MADEKQEEQAEPTSPGEPEEPAGEEVDTAIKDGAEEDELTALHGLMEPCRDFSPFFY